MTNAHALDRVAHPEERDRAISVVAQHSYELGQLGDERLRELLWVRGADGADLVVVHRRQALGERLRCLQHPAVATRHRHKMGAELADAPLQPGNR